MGYAIAEAALDVGHDVILISGPVNLSPPRKAKFISVSSTDEMFEAVHRHTDESDICVLCAAVADYKPAEVSPVKIKKRAAQVSLELIPTRDILQSLGRRQNRKFLLVGFAAETDHLEANATRNPFGGASAQTSRRTSAQHASVCRFSHPTHASRLCRSACVS